MQGGDEDAKDMLTERETYTRNVGRGTKVTDETPKHCKFASLIKFNLQKKSDIMKFRMRSTIGM